MNKKLQGYIMLMIATLIWGASFVAQKAGMDYVGPFTFNFSRATIAALVLTPAIIISDSRRKKSGEDAKLTEKEKRESKRLLYIGSALNGVILFGIMALQQVGIMYTDAGKAGFITAMYIVLVPIIGLFLGHKMRALDWICVILATVGLYHLCIPAGTGFTVSKGDFLVFLCSILCAVQMHTIAYYSKRVDGLRLSCYQFVIMSVFSAVPAFISEGVTIEALIAGALPILYAGVLSSGVAGTCQLLALKYVSPMPASFITSLESVFAVFTSIIILGEVLVMREMLGCTIMFVAIILAQIPSKESGDVDGTSI